MRNPLSTLFVILASLALLSPLQGCQRPISPAGARQDPLLASAYPSIATHPRLADLIVTDAGRIVWEAGTPTTPARLAVPIRSLSDYPVHTQYRILWYDADGREIGASSWRRATLEPQIEEQFQGNSTSGRAQAWRMEIRPAR